MNDSRRKQQRRDHERLRRRRRPLMQLLEKRQMWAADTLAVARPDASNLLDHFVDLNPPVNGQLATNDITFKYGFNSTEPSVASDDQVFAGDWNGLGFDQVGVARHLGGETHVFLDSDRDTDQEYYFKFSPGTGSVFAGDFNGDSFTDVGVVIGNSISLTYASTTGDAFLRNGSAVTPDVTFTYGVATDDVAAGDFNGDGYDDIAMVSNGTTNNAWDVLFATAGPTPYSTGSPSPSVTYTFGTDAWIPLAGDFDGNGVDDLVVMSPGTSTTDPGVNEWSVDTNKDGTTDLVYDYGLPGDIPYVGQFADRLWDGGGDGSTFTDAANWSGNVLPSAGENIVIEQPGAVTITHSSATASTGGITTAEAISVTGGTLIVSNPLISTDIVSINGGTLRLNDTVDTGVLNLNSGVLELGYSGSTGAGSLVASSGSIVPSGGNRTLTDNVTLMGTIGVNGSNNLVLSGNLSGSGGLTKSGSGALELSGSNTFTGATIISEGTVEVTSAKRLRQFCRGNHHHGQRCGWRFNPRLHRQSGDHRTADT